MDGTTGNVVGKPKKFTIDDVIFQLNLLDIMMPQEETGGTSSQNRKSELSTTKFTPQKMPEEIKLSSFDSMKRIKDSLMSPASLQIEEQKPVILS